MSRYALTTRIRLKFLLRCIVLGGILASLFGIIDGQFSAADPSSQLSSWMSNNEVFLNRLPQPYRWTYDDHPIAQPILFGKVNPFLWGLLIILATLYATLALTPDEHLKSPSTDDTE